MNSSVLEISCFRGYSFLSDYNLYFRSNIIINVESLHDYNKDQDKLYDL